jgi:hypothetical protein
MKPKSNYLLIMASLDPGAIDVHQFPQECSGPVAVEELEQEL